MELFRLEHQKLWRRKATIISVVLCVGYCVILGSLMNYMWFSFGTSPEDAVGSLFDRNMDGLQNIKDRQAYADQFKGPLTDEVLQDIVLDYQTNLGTTERGADISVHTGDLTDYLDLNSAVSMLWPELEDPGKRLLNISYVNPADLTDLYGRRNQAVEEFLELNNYTEEEKDFLREMNNQVEAPFQYDMLYGWTTALMTIAGDLCKVMAPFLAICLATVFSGEWHHNTRNLIATTRCGTRRLAFAKVTSALVFTVELWGMLTVGCVGLQLACLGTRGWDMPIQLIKMIAVAPWNMLQAEMYMFGYLLLNGLGYAGVILLLSVLLKNNFMALLAGLAMLYVPDMISMYLPRWGYMALDLLPFVGSVSDIFRTNIFHVLGQMIWSPWMILVVPFLLGMLCLPGAERLWSQRNIR